MNKKNDLKAEIGKAIDTAIASRQYHFVDIADLLEQRAGELRMQVALSAPIGVNSYKGKG